MLLSDSFELCRDLINKEELDDIIHDLLNTMNREGNIQEKLTVGEFLLEVSIKRSDLFKFELTDKIVKFLTKMLSNSKINESMAKLMLRLGGSVLIIQSKISSNVQECLYNINEKFWNFEEPSNDIEKL